MTETASRRVQSKAVIELAAEVMKEIASGLSQKLNAEISEIRKMQGKHS